MATIDWDEYKEYKEHSTYSDNFEILLDFMKSYYNMSGPSEIYSMLSSDDIGQMMLGKRDIDSAADLENFLYDI